MHLILSGMRASGKTTVGRAISTQINRPFIDLDDLTLDAFAESTVSDVWKSHGERAWRHAELAALRQVSNDSTARAPIVLALGGGTLTIPEAEALISRQRIERTCFVVYLLVDAAIIQSRLRASHDRPSLTGRDPAMEISDVLAAREPIYRRTADLVIDANSSDAVTTAQRIIRALAGN